MSAFEKYTACSEIVTSYATYQQQLNHVTVLDH
jgi:hypothetical protein